MYSCAQVCHDKNKTHKKFFLRFKTFPAGLSKRSSCELNDSMILYIQHIAIYINQPATIFSNKVPWLIIILLITLLENRRRLQLSKVIRTILETPVSCAIAYGHTNAQRK